jgi:hypothetical protein
MFKKVFFFVVVQLFLQQAQGQVSAQIMTDTSNRNVIKIIPSNYYAQHIGVFCKKELQLQKRTGLNLYIRLGSKDYVDYLERKPNAPAPRTLYR